MTSTIDAGSCARSSSGRPSGTTSWPASGPLSIRERTICPSRPVTTIRIGCRSGPSLAEKAEAVPCVALAQRLPPPLIVEVPLHRLFDAGVEILARPPPEFGLELGRIDRVPRIVAGPVRHKGDQFLARAVGRS